MRDMGMRGQEGVDNMMEIVGVGGRTMIEVVDDPEGTGGRGGGVIMGTAEGIEAEMEMEGERGDMRETEGRGISPPPPLILRQSDKPCHV